MKSKVRLRSFLNGLRELRLSQIESNPFRRLDVYPLDKAKIAVLKSSIMRTDFWSNVVARKHEGKYQLAYGHHRMQALREALGKDAKVSIIVRRLDDQTMLKMMAADNSDVYNLAPGFIFETVAAAKAFIEKQKSGTTGSTEDGRLADKVAEFLDWPRTRVVDALAQIAAIDRAELSKEAVELLPTPKAATALHHAVREAKKEGNPIPKREQVAIAKRVVEATEFSAPEAVKREVFERKYPAPKDATFRRFEDFVGDTARLLHKASDNLEKILELKTDLHSDIYRRTLEATYLRDSLEKVSEQAKELFSRAWLRSGPRLLKQEPGAVVGPEPAGSATPVADVGCAGMGEGR